MMHDYTKTDLDPQTRGMLDFAVKLTKTPDSMREQDVTQLRDLGMDDQQILSVVMITCVFNFMTRLADGLGVEVSPQRQKWLKGWLTGPAAQQEWLMGPKG